MVIVLILIFGFLGSPDNLMANELDNTSMVGSLGGVATTLCSQAFPQTVQSFP